MNRIALLFVVFSILPAHAAPRDELLRAVPDDYTFCVIAQNLRGDSATPDSSFHKKLVNSPLLKVLQKSPEVQKVQNIVEAIMKELEITPAQLWDDVLGDALVFAYRKGPARQPDAEDGLILLHARDEKLLARLVDRINEAQLKAGELKAVEKTEGKAGVIFRRVKGVEGEPADYYAVGGHRLVFSNRRPLLEATLQTLAAENKAEPAVLSRMKLLGVDNAPIVGLVNPRGFDADLAELAKAGQGSERAFLTEFAKYWKAVDAAAVSFRYTPSFELALSLHVRKGDMPKAATQFFVEASKRSPLWDRVPEDALFAAVGRIHLVSLVGMLSTFLTDQDRTKVLDTIGDAARPFLESDDLGVLARGIGPDVGFWLVAPSAESKTWVPDATLAVKIAPGAEGKQAEEAAIKGFDFLARLACLSQKGMRIHSEQQGEVKVQSLSHPALFPSGFQPAFASKGGYIVLAGSPRIISRFDPPKSAATAADEVPLVRVSVTAWRQYLKEHRGEIGKFLASANKLDPAAFDAQIESLMPILESMERIELVQRSTSERVTIALRLLENRR